MSVGEWTQRDAAADDDDHAVTMTIDMFKLIVL